LKLGEIIGKKVIGAQAQILGKIDEVEFDTSTLKITNLYVELEKTVIETMGFEKPRVMSSVKVSIPSEEINAVSDVVSLKKGATELRGIAKKI
jgi:sporulation protein YlmC with PRC-barrel domain